MNASNMFEDWLERFYAGDALAASRLMSAVERGGPKAEEVLGKLFSSVGRAYRIGVTGATGSGKSTLIDGLTRRYRRDGRTVGVIAEDPSSPLTGGAILGDRIRMTSAAGDPGVFIRSIASRGSETGFSALADDLADVLDAFGRDLILLETIGVGQLEHLISFSAQTTVVVFTPEAGDDVQSLKSGLTEVGDVFVLNKSDRAGADGFVSNLRAMVDIRYAGAGWKPPIVSTEATRDVGIEDLVEKIADHKRHLEAEGRLERRRVEGLRQRVRRLAEEKLTARFWQKSYIQKQFDGIFRQVTSGEVSPYEAARKLVESETNGGKRNP